MRRISLWLRSHPKTSFALALAALIVAAWFYRDWAAERAWRKFAAELRARGELVTASDLIRPTIPDEENFAALPMFKEVFAKAPEPVTPAESMTELFQREMNRPTRPLKPFEIPQDPADGPWWIRKQTKSGDVIDWEKGRRIFRTRGLISETTDDPVADVLRGLESSAELAAQWRQWRTTRKRCAFPVVWESMDSPSPPHFGLIQDAATYFSVRLRAHLAAGDSAAALLDFEDAMQAYRCLKGEPSMLTGLVRLAVLNVNLAALGEGLESRAWKEPELRALADALRAVDLAADYRLALSTERAIGNTRFQQIMHAGFDERAKMSGRSPIRNEWLTPILWSLTDRKIRSNQLLINRLYDELLARVRDRRIHIEEPLPGAVTHRPTTLEQWQYFFFYSFAHAIPQFERRYLNRQALVDESRVAIALERHRIKTGHYPEKLEALIPEFSPAVPLDPWTLRPLIYARTADGSYRLYSVGEDGKDDGGDLNPRKNFDRQDDAIWPHAPRPPSATGQ